MTCDILHLHFNMKLNYYIIITAELLIFLVCAPSTPPGSPPQLQAQILQNFSPEAGLSRHNPSSSRDPGMGHQQLAAEPLLNLGLSKQLNGALQRAGSSRGSGKSASAEDLLERSEERQMTPQHYRSHSSPTVERLNQVTLHSQQELTFHLLLL